MNIILINPSFESCSGFAVSYGEPLGLLYIAAAIERSRGHQVEIVDCVVDVAHHRKRENGVMQYGLSAQETIPLLSKKHFECLGITCTKFFDDSDYLDRFITDIKAAFPQVPLIGGGPEATLEYERYCRPGLLDYVIIGEGEAAIIDLLDALENGNQLAEVRSLVYRDSGGELHRNRAAPPCAVAELPLPARHLIAFPMYLRHRANAYYYHSPAAAILTSRACPYDCRFCNVQAIWGRKWRARTAQDVVDEMEMLVNSYGVREILVQDDNFIIDGPRVEAICDEIVRRRLDISWHIQAGLHIAHMNRRIVDKLVASGMYSLCVQIESCCRKTLRYINKRIDLQQAREIITYANRCGLFTQSNIIIGFYFETRDDIKESISIAEQLGCDQLNYLLAIPKPHTPMYDDCLKNGLVDADVPIRMPVASLHLTGKELQKICKRANRMHHLIRLCQLFGPHRFFTELLPKIGSPQRWWYLGRRLVAELVA